jgi:hypothetical protein
MLTGIGEEPLIDELERRRNLAVNILHSFYVIQACVAMTCIHIMFEKQFIRYRGLKLEAHSRLIVPAHLTNHSKV